MPVDLCTDLGESLPSEVVYESDCDNESRSSQKSLPHKKRIPNKLKRALTVATTRSVPAKCFKCLKCAELFPTQAALNVGFTSLADEATISYDATFVMRHKSIESIFAS